jgi:diguanylate cyclase (GGDEF)-like protein
MTGPPRPASGIQIDWRVVLGFAEPEGAGWDQVRSMQVIEMVRLVPVICITNLFSGLVLFSILWGKIQTGPLCIWLSAIIAMMISLLQVRVHIRRNAEEGAPRGALGRATLRGAVLGIIWSIPPIFFAAHAAADQQLAICLICAGVIASATLTTSAMPAAMLAFIGFGSAGLSAMMAHTGSPVLGLLPLVYAFCLALGGTASGRAFLGRKWAEVSLAEQDEVVSLLLREFASDQRADWLWQIDAARRLRQVHPRFASAARSDPESLEGMPLLRVLAGDAWEKGGALSEPLKLLLEHLHGRETFTDLDLPVQIGGETYWWRLSAAPRYDDQGAFAGFRGVGSDVTKQRRSADRIDRMARFDALTGLANRVHFAEVLRKALGRAHSHQSQCALMMIDLDKFKAVNDTLGHPIGDKLLKAVALRLNHLAGKHDLCARLGGDEFAIIVTDVRDAAAVDALGDNIVAALRTPFEIDGNLIRIGGSVGTAIGPRDGRSIDVLLRNADLALYRSKDAGRGAHRRFEPSYLAHMEKRRAIELALREALDNEQFRLVYQPIVTLADGRVAGFEALLRWRHPELGDVEPSEFVPIAEEARLLPRIGEWVIRSACAEAAHWPETVRLHVNLAADQLHDPQLPAILISALSYADLAAGRLELEISETMFARDRHAISAALDRLLAVGVRIGLDDFGSGTSALGLVSAAYFGTLKIDRPVVRAAAAGSVESLAIIRAAIALADTLGIETIAEGAETEAELTRVREIGFRHVQGYVTGAPMLAEDARSLLAEGERDVA